MILELYSHRIGKEVYQRGDNYNQEMESYVTRCDSVRVEPLFYIAHLFLDERHFSGNLYYLLHALVYNYDPNETNFVPVSNSSHGFSNQLFKIFTSCDNGLRNYHKNEEGRFPKISDRVVEEANSLLSLETISQLKKLGRSEAIKVIAAKGWKNKISWSYYAWIFRKSGDESTPTGYAEISDPDSPEGRIVFNYLEGIVYYSPDHYRPCPIKPAGYEGKKFDGPLEYHNGSFRIIK